MVALNSLALAATVLTGFSSASVIQRRQGTANLCAEACGNAVSIAKASDPCQSDVFLATYASCLLCAGIFNIWDQFSADLTPAGASCGLSTTPVVGFPGFPEETTGCTASTATPTPTIIAPQCNRDNCFRQLIQQPDVVGPFCARYTQTVTTPPAALPTFVSMCNGSPSRISSACSCLHPATASPTSSIIAPQCNRDNCFRQLIQQPELVGPFCSTYTRTVTTAPALPTFVSMCEGLPSRISSACSCLHPASATASATSTAATPAITACD